MSDDAFIVWLVDPVGMYERDWIYALLSLGGLSQIHEYHERCIAQVQPVPECPLIIFNHAIDYMHVFRSYEDAQMPFTAMHLSDETLGDDFSFYSFSMCRYVFRNYYHPVASELPNVYTFGIGYQTAFMFVTPRLQLETERFYQWCFAGNIHNAQRLEFLRHFFDVKPYSWNATMDTFASSLGLTLNDYKRMLRQSKFALCPPGQGNVDTYRLYEALEAGCIPVTYSGTQIQPDYWQKLFRVANNDDIPFITAATPAEMRSKMLNVLNNAECYADLLRKTQQFWREVKAKWGAGIVSRLSLGEA
jgi:Exostosin family